MSRGTKSWRQVRTSRGGTELVPVGSQERKGRDFIFRVLFPGVFVVMAFYRIFVMQPESGEFYSKLAAKAMIRIYQSQSNEEPVNHQSASNTVQRSSTAPVLLGWIV